MTMATMVFVRAVPRASPAVDERGWPRNLQIDPCYDLYHAMQPRRRNGLNSPLVKDGALILIGDPETLRLRSW